MEDGHERGTAGGNGHDPHGYARKFEELLERFPRADGEPWRGSEIEAATDHMVSASYVSALKLGKFRRPGVRQLELISDVVGFPFELWRLDPELWDEHLAKNPARGGFRSPRPRQPVPRVPAGKELAGLVNDLFEGKPSRTGEPYTDEEVAKRSRGRISAEEIRAMRNGEQIGPPPEIKLIGVSDVFGEPPSYWYVPMKPRWITDEMAATPSDPERLEADLTEAILESREALDNAEKRMLLAFIRLLKEPADVPVTDGSGAKNREDVAGREASDTPGESSRTNGHPRRLRLEGEA